MYGVTILRNDSKFESLIIAKNKEILLYKVTKFMSDNDYTFKDIGDFVSDFHLTYKGGNLCEYNYEFFTVLITEDLS